MSATHPRRPAKILDALPPNSGEIVVLPPVGENRRSLALKEYVKRYRGSVIVRQAEGDDHFLQQDSPLRALCCPTKLPAIAVGEAPLEEPAGLEHLVEDPLKEGAGLLVGQHSVPMPNEPAQRPAPDAERGKPNQ